MRISSILIVFIASIFVHTVSWAENGVSIQPGEWEITSTTTSDSLDAPNVQKSSSCIELSEITASDLTPHRGECEISESSANGNTLTWKVACDMTVGTMEGRGNFTSANDAGSGTMNIVMDVQNDQFEMLVNWEARRLGDCK